MSRFPTAAHLVWWAGLCPRNDESAGRRRSSGLLGTGFEKSGSCTVGGGTFWLTTAGNVVPGQIVELRVVVWDVGDTAYDSSVLLDGFKWLSNATLPGTG